MGDLAVSVSLHGAPVADSVLRATTRQPMVLIRARGSQARVRTIMKLKKLLVPLDGSLRSEVILPYVTEIASKFGGDMTLFQVVPDNGPVYANAVAYLESMCGKLGEQGYTANFDVRIGSVADNIIDHADEQKIDMVAMTTQGKGATYPWLLGSVAQKVVTGGTTALMLIKE